MKNRTPTPGPGDNQFENLDQIVSHPGISQQMDDYMIAHKNILSPIIQTGLTGVMVNAFCWTPETLKLYWQMGLPPSVKMASPFLYNLKPLIRPMAESFLHSQKQSLIKNGVIANRDHVHHRVDEALGGAHKEESQASASKKKLNEAAAIGLTTVLIGGADTILTNWHANKKTMAALMVDVGPLDSVMKMMKFAKLGVGIRGARNFTNAGIITVTTMFIASRRLDANGENKSYGLEAGITMLAGGAAGLLTNSADLIYNEKMRNYNKATMMTPSSFRTAQKIYANGGVRGFLCGSAFSVMVSAAAYAGIGISDYIVSEKIFSKKRINEYHTRQSLFKQDIEEEAQATKALQNVPPAQTPRIK